MLAFTHLPPDGSPSGRSVRFAVGSDTPSTLRLRLEEASGRLLAERRYAGVTEARFDAAPVARRLIRFGAPVGGGTGFRTAAGRTAAVRLTAEADNVAQPIVSDTLTILPAAAPVTPPQLLTAMPRTRPIAPGECDELSFYAATPLAVTVTARASGAADTVRRYTSAVGGLQLFRLDTRDFPPAEGFTVDAGACGEVRYTVFPAPEGARRLAWRSAAGSVEHYTFPFVVSASVAVARDVAEGPDGRVAARSSAETRTTLASAYETREVLEALAGALSSPEVWLVEGDEAERVLIATDRAVVHRHGELLRLEIDIRPAAETPQPWN